MNRLLIYTEKTSERLSYIFDFILGDLLGLEYELSSDKAKFTAHTGPKFSYASQALGDEIFLGAADLLFQTDLSLQPVDFVEYENLIGFYRLSKPAALPFDMFASSFLMLTGYNEYLIHKKDKYERYRASQSMNYRADFLEKPMINYYALGLKKILLNRYPALVFRQNKFEYIPTFDIDMLFSYLGKGMGTNLGGFARALLLSNFKEIKDRYQVLFGGKRDPYDSIDYILDVCKKYSLKSIFFFLVGDRSTLDRNIPHTNPLLRNRVKQVSEVTETGVHLSYMSHISNQVMSDEIDRLVELTGKEIIRNRFHYLRFTMPRSFMQLIKIGIREDYSYGYASRAGFRGATCSPFKFFNLLNNERTELKIFPFAFMDTTYTYYRKTKPDKALEKILLLMQHVKEVEGPFIALWHNSSFAEDRIWKGWRNVFETVAHEAAALMQKP